MCGQPCLYAVEAAYEFGVGSAQGGFGFDTKMPTQIGHDEHQVTVFLGDLGLGQGITRLDQFGCFLGDLGDHIIDLRPVKPDTGRAFCSL